MKVPVRLVAAGLGGLVLEGELDFPDEALAAKAPALLDDPALAERWGVSPRTLARLRAKRAIAYVEPVPRAYRYALADVEAYETAHRTATRRAR